MTQGCLWERVSKKYDLDQEAEARTHYDALKDADICTDPLLVEVGDPRFPSVRWFNLSYNTIVS